MKRKKKKKRRKSPSMKEKVKKLGWRNDLMTSQILQNFKYK